MTHTPTVLQYFLVCLNEKAENWFFNKPQNEILFALSPWFYAEKFTQTFASKTRSLDHDKITIWYNKQ